MFSLRDFHYLNSATIENYLSTIERGLVKYIAQRDSTNNPEWGFKIGTGELISVLSGSMNIPLPDANVERKGKKEEITVEVSKESTIHSQVDTLIEYLDPMIQRVDSFDVNFWDGMKDGQFLLIDAKVLLPEGYKKIKDLKAATTFIDFADRILPEFVEGKLKEEPSTLEAIQKSREYVAESESVSGVNSYIIPKGSVNPKRYHFVGKLIIDYLVDTDLEDLSFGHHKVFCRVKRKIGDKEDYLMFDPSLSGVDLGRNRSEKRKNKRSMEPEYATSPGIIINPIAIYSE